MLDLLEKIPNDVYTRIAVYGTMSAGFIGEILPAGEKWEEFIKTPITLALILLAGFAIWMSFRNYEKMMDKVIDSNAKVADSIKKLAEELHERPCVRKSDND